MAPVGRSSSSQSRDSFSASVKRRVGERAGFLCSFPGCRTPTIGPSSASNASTLLTGEAAHISAASKGGPRYLAAMSKRTRSSIDNAIWLCALHATVIDKDPKRYPRQKLALWKKVHETLISQMQYRLIALSGKPQTRWRGGTAPGSGDAFLDAVPLLREGPKPILKHTFQPPPLTRDGRAALAKARKDGFLFIEQSAARLIHYWSRYCERNRIPILWVQIREDGIDVVLNMERSWLAVPGYLGEAVWEYLAQELGGMPSGCGGSLYGTYRYFDWDRCSRSATESCAPRIVSWLRRGSSNAL